MKAAAEAREGKHGGIVCRTLFQVRGEPVTHTLGATELRIDKPLPPKVDAPKPVANARRCRAAGQPAARRREEATDPAGAVTS